MIGVLRALLRFLETRFPEKVVVTKTDYDALNAKLGALDGLTERVSKLEVVASQHSQMMGIGQTGKFLGGSLER